MTLGGTSFAQTGITGPSSSAAPYLVPMQAGAQVKSILTVGDSADNNYRMVGIPDGLGAFDNGDGTTFTVVMNHELNQTAGIVRAHGNMGAFVSKWIINKSDLSVVSGEDLATEVRLFNTATQQYDVYNSSNPMPIGFGRFCSADLAAPSAYYNTNTGKGSSHRIFMNGEETGNEGRGLAHIVNGPDAGVTYELPYLGKFSWENSVANPATGDKTVVAGFDDATPGQVYIYIGEKTNTGNDIEKAGLTGGNLYGISVSGMLIETNAAYAGPNTAFTMVNLGDVHNKTGATLQTESNNAGVTQFLRPEDGAWDPQHPEDLYFNTTNGIGVPSRLWKLHFTNINDLTQGGTITAVLDGTEGQVMLDNIGIDHHGNALVTEDPGGNIRDARVWNYNIATDAFTSVLQHDSSRFVTGGANFITIDEEASGVIDVSDILGNGWFLCSDQVHVANGTELVERGQFFAFLNPNTECAGLSKTIATTNGIICSGTSSTLTAGVASSYLWSNGATTQSITVNTPGKYSVTLMGANGCSLGSDTVSIVTIPNAPVTVSASTVCEGTPALLSLVIDTANIANPSNPFAVSTVWNNNGVAIPGSENLPYYAAFTSGAYTITLMDSVSGCSRTSSIKNITVKPTPVAGISAAGNTVVCDGESVTLNADIQPNYTYRWLRDGVQVASSGTTYNAKIGGNYQVVAVLNGCRDTSDSGISVGIYELPNVGLTNTGVDTFCSGSSTMLEASTGLGTYEFAFTKGASVLQTGSSTSYMATVGGNYRVIATDLNTGCVNKSDAVTLKSYNTPYAKAIVDNGGNKNLNNGPVALRANFSPNLGYQWTRNGANIPGANGMTFAPSIPGSYNVVTSSGNGLCSTTSNTVVVIGNIPARLTAATEGFNVTAFPNPVAGELTISVAGLNDVDGTLQVLDMSGRVVSTQSINSTVATINMTNLANGLYMVQFNDKAGNTASIKINKN